MPEQMICAMQRIENGTLKNIICTTAFHCLKSRRLALLTSIFLSAYAAIEHIPVTAESIHLAAESYPGRRIPASRSWATASAKC